MKTFEVVFKKKDNSVSKTEWFHKPILRSMRSLIDLALKRGEELDMAIAKIRRIN